MKIYSNSLTEADIRAAVAELPGAQIDQFQAMRRPQIRSRGWNVHIIHPGSNRRANTGIHGAGYNGAAGHDEWGAFLSRLYDQDPDMRAAHYTGRDYFHRVTEGRYRRTPAPTREGARTR
jgi:hypothetical protein